MVGSSKILTVSYGTFSCTLEGFDDSFSTMKDIAEYFRDLAADDRYFGAEPPTPDADMLARIAQGSMDRRVDALTNGDNIVLRAAALEDARDETAEPEAQAEDEAEPVMPPAALAPAALAAVRFDADDTDDADEMAEDDVAEEDAPAAEMQDESADDEESEEPSAHPDADSVAAKLQRIRAVVSRKVEDDEQDEPSIFAEQDDDTPAVEPTAEVSADFAAAFDSMGDDEDETVAEDATPEAINGRTVRTRIIQMQRADDTAETEEETTEAEMAEEDAPEAELTEAFDDLGEGAEAEVEAEAVAELAELDGVQEEDIAQADDSSLTDEAEADLQAELATLADTLETEDDDAAALLEEIAEADEGHDAESDDDLSSDLNDVDDVAARADDDEDEPLRPRRVRMPITPEEDEANMSRIMAQTEEQMSAPDTNRRQEAISQLKAAVAATEADRGPSEREREEEEAVDTFRDDLRQVVRPTRPIRPTRPEGSETRPVTAPLKLVASQRVDVEDEAEEAPEAVAEPAPAPAAEPAPEVAQAAAEAGGFAAFAQEMGATDLADLLEAAAAYTSFIEGSEDFSRPQLMSKVKEMPDHDYSREEGLRSFGTLLRQGRITKVRNGRFQVSDETRFNPERRAG